ncbi:MAG: hypothetical protein H0V14_08460, partial [Chitinophagaceae bacterium]|nr:hypothetical protein [Chitinophagaceae bacterium]
METNDKIQPKKKKTLAGKIANIVSYILVSLVFLILLLVLSLQTSPVQNFARGKVQNFLEKKLKTRVEIGKLDISFPNAILLKNIYIEDQTKDTLLSGGLLKVDLSMLLLLKNEIQIKEIRLKDITAKIKRVGTDTVFNFQFITDAFMGDQTKVSENEDTSTLKMNIDNIIIDRTRIVYKDVLTGNDLNLYLGHLDAPIKTFDINRLYFDIPTFTVTGLKGYFYQNDPLKAKVEEAVAQAVTTPGNFLQLKNDEILFRDIDFVFKSVPTAINAGFKFASLTAHPDTLNLKDGKFDFKDLALVRSDIDIQMSNKEAPPVTAKQEEIKDSIPPFTITADAITISESNLKMNNTSMPVLKDGMDYGHLDIKDLNFSADNLLYNIDTIAASVKEASFKEKSGFVLNQFNADFLFTGNQTSLQNFYIKTPGTVLRNKAVITYPSLAQLATNPDLLSLDLNFESSSIQVKDMLTFAPLLRVQPAFSNPSQVWMINGRVFGRVSDLHFDDLRFKGFGNTTLFVSGSIKGLPDPAKLSADLDIKHLNTGRKDILSLLPANTLPANITLPETISASGTVKGNMNNVASNLTINTSLGAARLNGSIQNFSNPKTAKYDYAVNAIGINLGTIMGDPKTFGTLSGNFKMKGNGFDPNTANAKVNGVISAVGYNQYTYRNIKLDGNIANKNYSVEASVTDPNIDLDIAANGAFNGKYPSVHLTANIDSIKAKPLHFTPQTLIYHGKIEGDFTSVDPDNLAGNFLVTNSILVNDTQRFELDTMELTAVNTPEGRQLKVRSDFIALQIAGNYTLTQLADVFQQSIEPYYAQSVKRNRVKVAPYDFTITGGIIDHPALKVFMPELKKLDPININAHFTPGNWNANIDAPSILYGTLTLNGLKLTAETKNNQLAFNTS